MDLLMRLQADVSRANLRRDVGRCLDVLVETAGPRKGLYQGRSYKDAPEVDGMVRVRSSRALRPGALIRCRIVSSSVHDLNAELLP
jgi:ribosomal protein S12 methylthiotransferase